MSNTKTCNTTSLISSCGKHCTGQLSRLFFTVFCFSFTSPAFAFSPTSNLEELIYAAIGSAIVSLIAMVVVLIKLKISLLPRLLAMLVTPVLVFPLCMAGSMGMGYIAHEIKQYQQEQDAAHIASVEEDAWQHNFLRINACEGNHALLQSELASGRHQIENKLRALNECVLPQADAQALRILLQDAVSNDKDGRAYCTYLPPVLQSMNTVLLDVFVEQKLSLACTSPKYAYVPDTSKVAPAWWDILNDGQITSDTKDTDRLLTILRYLQAHNVDMKIVANDRSLLTIAMESGKVDLVLFALDAGVDPYAIPENDSMLSPQQIWTLQRFGYADAGPIAYSEADQKRIQSHLREMNSKEAASLAQKLPLKGGLAAAKDGGAGLLAYLIKSSNNMRELNRAGRDLIDVYAQTSPAVLDVLDRLNDQQLRDFICPDASNRGDDIDNSNGHALYARAVSAENQALVNFFKRRKMPETCPGMPRQEQ
ncbi:hypothetical protein [Undibacterium sp. Tian12W]|uniref:hypothetical protein n=1 Tax=Undibacterium sp. Tian12W TaxID=3413054 RepID=UPI003BF450A1